MRVEAAGPKRRGTGLTALIDVVFLLLLFFMLASTFSRFAIVEVALGGRAGVAPAADVVAVLLGVDGEGNLHVNGARVGPEALAEALRAATGGEPARILVRPVAGASVQDIVRALERARSAGVGDVILVR
jgi:biopolymer transport protein ExbD